MSPPIIVGEAAVSEPATWAHSPEDMYRLDQGVVIPRVRSRDGHRILGWRSPSL